MAQAQVLVVEDDNVLRQALSDTLDIAGYNTQTVASGEEAMSALHKFRPDIIVSDVQMDGMDGHTLLSNIQDKDPQIPFLLMTAYGNVNDAVSAMRSGAVDYVEKPIEPEKLVSLVSRYVAISYDANQDPIAEDPMSVELFDLAKRVAQSETTVLLTGESGAGKEVVARFIHRQSKRQQGPFVAINCAAIPDNMLEATLFGYEKGAFTGAHASSAGKFEQAQTGTILLDEISEMSLGLQAKLLRVIQEKEVERLGAKKTINLDVRLIATSNRALHKEVADGRFREDLFYRLNVFPIRCLALRERPLDIVPITNYLLDRHGATTTGISPKLSKAAEQRLKSHRWPGNVRELENVIQRALILHSGDVIELADLQLDTQLPIQEQVPSTEQVSNNLNHGVKNHEFQLILEALEKYKGNRGKVADSLGVSPRTLRYKLAKMRDAGIEI
ncbi:MAG: sigma-54 dependent transcriptional regulator [Gammaproteobacteria bacterium]|nr:sigma-54 dependent transcriptional regulator [Gammaproteobacteria bacterium]NNJ71704.1 sigma-54-dependent Fis family transcriptional regulator [Enterobacterales bacterium]